MGLGFRHTLILIVALSWLGATLMVLPRGLSQGAQVGWLALLFAAMWGVDRVYVAIATRRHGVDPLRLHWSRLRNREGNYVCAACQSIFLVAPEDGSDAGLVHCGDCGHAIAPWGEMKPRVRAQGQVSLERMARQLRR